MVKHDVLTKVLINKAPKTPALRLGLKHNTNNRALALNKKEIIISA